MRDIKNATESKTSPELQIAVWLHWSLSWCNYKFVKVLWTTRGKSHWLENVGVAVY